MPMYPVIDLFVDYTRTQTFCSAFSSLWFSLIDTVRRKTIGEAGLSECRISTDTIMHLHSCTTVTKEQ